MTNKELSEKIKEMNFNENAEIFIEDKNNKIRQIKQIFFKREISANIVGMLENCTDKIIIKLN